MRKKITIAILGCIIIFVAGTFYTFGQNQVRELKDKKVTIKMEKQPLWVIFKHLIENYDVAIGFEQSTLDTDHNDYYFETNLPKKIDNRDINRDGKIIITEKLLVPPEVKRHWFTVNFENGRLEDILNQIVGQMGNYKWEINDDVVNIFPIRGRDERYQKLLELNIKNFTIQKPISIGSIKNDVLGLPEVVKFLNENEIYSTEYRAGSFENLDRFLNLEFKSSDLTLRELLNKITKLKKGGWILQRNPVYGSKEKEYIDIDI